MLRNKFLAICVAMPFLITACGESKQATSETASVEKSVEAPAASEPAIASTPTHNHAASESHAGMVEKPVVNGEKVFKSLCAMCHQTGAGGAPIVGNKEMWAPRIAQGVDVLYKHSIDGYETKDSVMPARGGNLKLTDEEMKAAVDYMLSKSQ